MSFNIPTEFMGILVSFIVMMFFTLSVLSTTAPNGFWTNSEFLGFLTPTGLPPYNYTAIHCELERIGVSLKKLKRIAKERNQERRMNFLIHMGQYSPEQFGFIDETSKDERTAGRLRGRAAKAQRASNHQVLMLG